MHDACIISLGLDLSPHACPPHSHSPSPSHSHRQRLRERERELAEADTSGFKVATDRLQAFRLSFRLSLRWGLPPLSLASISLSSLPLPPLTLSVHKSSINPSILLSIYTIHCSYTKWPLIGRWKSCFLCQSTQKSEMACQALVIGQWSTPSL